jgi:hypothetical protein
MPPCFALSSVSYPPTRFRTDFAPPTSCLPDPFSHVSIRRTDCTSLMDSEKETREAPESASSSAERLWCSSDGAGTPRRSERRQRGEDWRREIGGFWRRDAQRECPRRGQWWRRWELNPRPMDSPRRPLRAYPAFWVRGEDAHRRAYRAASSLLFSPPPYEPQGSGQASGVYAQADRTSPIGRTSPLTRREPALECWLLLVCAFYGGHATPLASCGSRPTVEPIRPHSEVNTRG